MAAGRTRIDGKLARLFIGAVQITDLRDIRVTIMPKIVESEGMGYKTPQRTLDAYDFKVTAGRSQRPTSMNKLGASVATMLNSSTSLGYYTVKVYADLTATNLVFQGPVVPDNLDIGMEDGVHQTEEISFSCAGDADYIAGTAMLPY